MIRLSPLVLTANTANDPAFSNADWVKQEILAPPFAWPWNRTTASPTAPTFSTQAGVTDYKVSLPNFGWLEKAVAYETNNSFAAHELEVSLNLTIDTLSNQPTRISKQLEDGSGNITFRISPAPDDVYAVVVDYQNSASLFTDPTQTWSPIPDYMSYVYNTGFDAKSFDYFSDPRAGGSLQLFYTQLANVSEGLTSTQKNIFLESKLNSVREMNRVQQGR